METQGTLFPVVPDYKKFFDSVRKSLFQGSLKTSQVEGLNTLLDATGGLPIKHRAYILATAYHETARTMQAITEYGGKTYFDKYDTGKLAKDLGNTPEKDGDGFKYRGRGFVMITGYANYKKAGEKLNINLVDNPDLALDTKIAATILVRGSTEAWFTKYKVSDFSDYINMRRVINGLDRASTIAGYAVAFEEALKQC